MPKYKPKEKKKVFNIDFDGTLTLTDSGAPYQEMIEKVRNLYYNGDIIIIWTARLWEDAAHVAAWLTKHNVPYHGIKMEKGGSDIYIDDRNALLIDIIKEG